MICNNSIRIFKSKKIIQAIISKSDVIASARLGVNYYIKPDYIDNKFLLVFHNSKDLDNYVKDNDFPYTKFMPQFESELHEVNRNIKNYHKDCPDCNCNYKYFFLLNTDKSIIYNSRKYVSVLDIYFTLNFAIVGFQQLKNYTSKDVWKPFRFFGNNEKRSL